MIIVVKIGKKYEDEKEQMKLVNIVDVLKELDNEEVDSDRLMIVSKVIEDVIFYINKCDLKHLYISSTYPLLKFDINYNIKFLVDKIRGISGKVMFIVDDNIKDMRIGDVLKNGKYWKENKMIDSCENKDKICKSRAECMREITEQTKFNVEEEFKKICIKERENVLENIHKAIEDEAKKGNSEIKFKIQDYINNEFRYIYWTSKFYNPSCDNPNCKLCTKFYIFDVIHILTNRINDNSYVWKFVDKLDYENSKHLSLALVDTWIKEKLKYEGFDVGVSSFNLFKISW